jgi:hypothetical protein
VEQVVFGITDELSGGARDCSVRNADTGEMISGIGYTPSSRQDSAVGVKRRANDLVAAITGTAPVGRWD